MYNPIFCLPYVELMCWKKKKRRIGKLWRPPQSTMYQLAIIFYLRSTKYE